MRSTGKGNLGNREKGQGKGCGWRELGSWEEFGHGKGDEVDGMMERIRPDRGGGIVGRAME